MVCKQWESDESPPAPTSLLNGGELLERLLCRLWEGRLALWPPLHVHHRVLPFPAGCPHCKKVIPHFTATADIFKDDRKVRRPLFASCPASDFALLPVLHLPPFHSALLPE